MKNQGGFLTIVAIVLIVIFGLLGSYLVRMFISTTSSTSHVQAYTKAWSLAQSGVEQGLYQLSLSLSVCNGNPQGTGTLATGQYRYVCPTPTSALSTLAAALGLAGNTISLTDASAFGSSGSVRVDNEIIFYTNKIANTLNGLKRGARNTIAASHNIGAQILQNQYIISGQGNSSSFTNTQGAAVIAQGLEFVRFFAADAAGQFYVYNGVNWSKTLDYMAVPINTIYCVYIGNCLAGGDNGSAYVYNFAPYNNNGAVWTMAPGSTQGFITNIKQIACTSTTHCIAVGDALKIGIFDGSSWNNSQPITNMKLAGVSCSNNVCKAVGNNTQQNDVRGIFLKEDNNWNASPPFEPAFGVDELRTISCINANCVAGSATATGGGKFYSYDGNNWSAVTTYVPPSPIRKIFCIDASHCQAVGDGGNFYSYNGSSWRLLQNIGSSTIYDLACTNLNHCYAVGDGGNFYFYNGVNWTLSQNIGTASIRSISNAIDPIITLTSNN